MRVTEISYRRIRNLGNYENESVEITVALNEGEDAKEAFAAARTWTHRALFGARPEEGQTSPTAGAGS